MCMGRALAGAPMQLQARALTPKVLSAFGVFAFTERRMS